MNTYVTHLESALDGTRFPAGQVHTVHQGRPLWVRYDLPALGRAVRPDTFAARPPSLWRYRELLPLPFDAEAATRYGTLVALTLEAKRDPKPRRLDLMIAAIASARGLPLYTRNEADFKGLEDMLEVVAV